MPHKRKKKGERKAKEAGRRESKRRKGSETFEILLSAHARTLKAVIWHQEQKLVQCLTCKQRLDSLDSFWLDSDLKMA